MIRFDLKEELKFSVFLSLIVKLPACSAMIVPNVETIVLSVEPT